MRLALLALGWDVLAEASFATFVHPSCGTLLMSCTVAFMDRLTNRIHGQLLRAGGSEILTFHAVVERTAVVALQQLQV